MKAVVCKTWGPPESLVIETLPDLSPSAGEVVIDVKAAGVNFPDVLIIQNKYQFKPELPFTPGSEVAGVVNAVGVGVSHVKAGDHVIAFIGQGAFASQVKASAKVVMPMPPGMAFDTAAAFTLTYGTSHHAVVDRGQLKAGETMLVLGAAGGVGLAAIEIGKAIGARVIAAASSDEKLAVCKDHGADALINYSTEDLRERVKELTDGRGPDVIYDPVGGIYAEPAFRSIAWRGRYLVVGFTDGQIPRLPLNLVLLKGCAIVGVFWGDFIQREPQAAQVDLRDLIEMLAKGQIKPLISGRYSLQEAPQAILELSQRRAQGKLIVLP
jgi:NADPH2:quinone reductase